MEHNTLTGRTVLGVVLRLAGLSLVVGIVLSAFDITPANFLDRIRVFAVRIYDLGFHAFDWAFGYLALGAMVVVPVWVISRLLAARRGSDG